MSNPNIARELVRLAKSLTANVAQEILSQILAIDRYALMAWGAKDFVAGAKDLTFVVRGTKAGPGSKIVITLEPDDTYKVTLWAIRGTPIKVKVIREERDVYVENLVSVIDEMVG